MKYSLLAIALVTTLLSATQEMTAIAATPINPKSNSRRLVKFAEPKAPATPGPEYASLFLILLSIPSGKVLHLNYHAWQKRVLRQQVEALERVWHIKSYSSPEQ